MTKSTNPMADRKHEFNIIVIGGMLLSLNCGFLNGATLLDDPGVATTHVTGSATRLGRAIADGDFHDFYFFGGLIVMYTVGSIIAGILTPSKKFSVSNRYGTVLIFSSILILTSSIIAIKRNRQSELYDMTVAMATGIQNAALSRYSGNIIRVGHVTGASVDIGVLSGRYVRGQKENLWKIQILILLVFTFWLGGVLVQWIDPLLDNKILFVNSAYMVLIGTIYVLYWNYSGLEKLEKMQTSDTNDLAVGLVDVGDVRNESHLVNGLESSYASSNGTNDDTDDTLAFVNDIDSDFNLTKQEAAQLHISVDRLISVDKPSEPVALQDREGVEFTFIMVGASLLALNSGCINAISSLSSRGLFTANVSGSVTNFGLTAFSFDNSELLMESTLVWVSFIFGSFISGLMSSSSVFRLGISYARILLLVTALLSAASVCNLALPGSMLYYCFSSMACGVQNGMITKYSGGVIRTTNVTGGFADIGGILGRMIKGNFDDLWQLKVLVPLVVAFIMGGSIGFVLYEELDDSAPVVSAVFMGVITISYIFGVKYVSGTEVSYTQLIFGKYTYPEIKKFVSSLHMSTRMETKEKKEDA